MSEENKNNFSETQSYSSDESKKTKAYNKDSEATQHYGTSSDKTQYYETADKGLTDKTVAHDLGIGDNIELNQNKYKIVDIISGEGKTGEAVIYKIEDTSNSIRALKLYFEFRDKRFEPNPEALKRIKTINDPDILRLYDYGTGSSKYKNKFCFEISDYSEGGDLISNIDFKKKYTIDFIKSNVIPEIHKGIKKLHQNRIYHCDLKPQNVFYLNKEQTDLVIGDYGSAKTFEQSSDKNLVQTSIAKGTDFYVAPEQARGIISDKNDYYSFGMVVIHLLYPDQVNKSNLRLIVERQFSGKEIIDYNPEYEELNNLIAGLTLQDINNRWGEKEVERWLNGESIEVQYKSRADITPIKLGKTTIINETDLVQYMETDENWYDDLIEDSEGYALLLTWISNLQDLGSKKIFDRMVRYYQQDGKEYVREAILRYFRPGRPVLIDMKSYDFLKEENLKKLVEQFFKHLDDIWKITEIDKLKFYLFQLEFLLRNFEKTAEGNLKTMLKAILDKISSVMDVSPKENFEDFHTVFYSKLTDKKLIELFYAFDQNRVFKDLSNKSYKNLEEVGLLFAIGSEIFKNKYLTIEKEYFLKELNRPDLLNLNYRDFLFEIFYKEIKTEIKYINLEYNEPKRGKHTIIYKLGKSVSDYLSENNVNNKIEDFSQGEEKIILKKNFFNNPDLEYNEFIKEFIKKHKVLEEKIDSTSKESVRNSIKIDLWFYKKLLLKDLIFLVSGVFFSVSILFLYKFFENINFNNLTIFNPYIIILSVTLGILSGIYLTKLINIGGKGGCIWYPFLSSITITLFLGISKLIISKSWILKDPVTYLISAGVLLITILIINEL
ncbi:MAG: protein kinase, partial [Bacteroidetes bacterium]|nr:protein kinase [Bacteroidota bacterium]